MLLSGVTGSGESVTATVMSASGVVYAVFSVSLLFVWFVSLPVPLTPKAVATVPSLSPRTVESAFTTTVKLSVPGANEGFVQVKVGVALTAGSVQFQPAGTVADWKRSEPLLKTLKLTL